MRLFDSVVMLIEIFSVGTEAMKSLTTMHLDSFLFSARKSFCGPLESVQNWSVFVLSCFCLSHQQEIAVTIAKTLFSCLKLSLSEASENVLENFH